MQSSLVTLPRTVIPWAIFKAAASSFYLLMTPLNSQAANDISYVTYKGHTTRNHPVQNQGQVNSTISTERERDRDGVYYQLDDVPLEQVYHFSKLGTIF